MVCLDTADVVRDDIADVVRDLSKTVVDSRSLTRT
jgi:hypothetical protein